MIQASRRPLLSLAKTLIPQLGATKFPPNTFSTSTLQSKSAFESNLLRLLTNEIEFDSDYAPPHQAEKKFNAFMVEDRPAEQFVTLWGKSTLDETIKIEATMFDGASGDDQLHISVLVDVLKADGGDILEFVCSAWPQRLEIENFYVIGTLSRPYTGPHFRNSEKTIQSAMYEFLNARSVNNDLCLFLHRYVWNKDKVEHIQRLKLLRSYVER